MKNTKRQLRIFGNKNSQRFANQENNNKNPFPSMLNSPNKENHLSSANYSFKSPNHHIRSPNYQVSSPNHQLSSPANQISSPAYQISSPTHQLSSPNNIKLLSPASQNPTLPTHYHQQQQLSPSTFNLNILSPPKTTCSEEFEGFRSNKGKQFLREQHEGGEEILFSGFSKDGKYKVKSRAFQGVQLSKAVQYQRKMNLSHMFSASRQKDRIRQKLQSFECAKTSTKAAGMVKGYAVNTHNGISRDYNEDRVSITLNIKKHGLKSQFFAVYDGHGGSSCCDYLKDSLHEAVINHKDFPFDPKKALHESILSCEHAFLQMAKTNKGKVDRSGSCALVALIVEEYVYIANVGDSRAILSSQNGKYAFNLTRDHRPIDQKEQERILRKGGKIYRTQMEPIAKTEKKDIIIGPLRIFPGKLSVSRTLGDIEAKSKDFGGIQGVILPEADIRKFKISPKQDFILLCCDGILERMQSTQIVDLSWSVISKGGDLHEMGGKVVDIILRQCMIRGSSDNLTVILIWLNYGIKSPVIVNDGII